MREIVISTGQDQCGFHVNPNDPIDIAWGIINSVQDPQRKLQLGQNGRKRVLQEFTWDEIAKKTLKLYNELLESKKPKKQ
jgi:glycosyltransferase involved in cell wall biosynthesis